MVISFIQQPHLNKFFNMLNTIHNLKSHKLLGTTIQTILSSASQNFAILRLRSIGKNIKNDSIKLVLLLKCNTN